MWGVSTSGGVWAPQRGPGSTQLGGENISIDRVCHIQSEVISDEIEIGATNEMNNHT